MEVLQSSVQVRNECSELMTEERVYFVVSGVRANVPIRVINAHGTNFVFSENRPRVLFFEEGSCFPAITPLPTSTRRWGPFGNPRPKHTLTHTRAYRSLIHTR